MAEKGLSFVLKLGSTVIAGLRATSFTLNGETVDITTKDSASQWRELLAAAGVISMTISGSGVFVDNGNVQTLRASCIARTLSTYTILFESGDDYTGLFQVSNIENAGDFNGEVTYNLTLESSGVIAFTAV